MLRWLKSVVLRVDCLATQVAGNYAVNRSTAIISLEELAIPIEADAVLRELFDTLKQIPDNSSGPTMFDYPDAVRELVAAEHNFLSDLEKLIRVSLAASSGSSARDGSCDGSLFPLGLGLSRGCGRCFSRRFCQHHLSRGKSR